MWATAAPTALAVVAMSGAALLPYCLLRKRGNGSGVKFFSFLSISHCNCFACGVFLATCFLALIPHTRMNEAIVREAFKPANGTGCQLTGSYSSVLSTELVVLLGILLMLLIEQFFAACLYCKVGGERFAIDTLTGIDGMTSFNDAYYSKRSTKSANSMSSFCAPSAGERNTKGVAQKLNRGVILGNERTDRKRTHGDFEPLVNLDDLLDGDVSSDEELELGVRDEENDDEFGSIEFRTCHNSALRSSQFSRGDCANKASGNAVDGVFQTVMLLLAMSTHSVFEGVALGAQETVDQFIRMLLSVMLHEVLCCLSFGISLSSQNVSPRTAVFSTLFLAGAIPTGILIMSLIGKFDGTPVLITRFVLEGLSAGIFIYVACVEMLAPEFGGHAHGACHAAGAQPPAAARQPGSLKKALAVCLGALVTSFFGASVHKL